MLSGLNSSYEYSHCPYVVVVAAPKTRVMANKAARVTLRNLFFIRQYLLSCYAPLFRYRSEAHSSCTSMIQIWRILVIMSRASCATKNVAQLALNGVVFIGDNWGIKEIRRGICRSIAFHMYIYIWLQVHFVVNRLEVQDIKLEIQCLYVRLQILVFVVILILRKNKLYI